MAEACDLGAALVRTHARSVWASFLPVYGVAVLLALCTVEIAGWLPGVVIFCLKPWFDRSLLFCLSRAVFGQPTGWSDLWHHRRVVWGGQWLNTLLWRRLSPWRSYTQAIDQLEGQRGAARRRRRKQLLHGRQGAALLMQMLYGQVEMALGLACLSIVFWFVPGAGMSDMLEWMGSAHPLLEDLFLSASYAAVVGLLEPFFVASGFSMYLNRRVELEAWDIEQDFRRAFA
ncbi:MAG: hypothetical protein JWP29_3448 [Rhodoferax sp.]|nr:hypothetical protein [Rhodoferax sp.]